MAYELNVEEATRPAARGASSVPILDAMGVRVLEAVRGGAVAELPAEPNRNHVGVAYAGSLYSVAEMLGGVLAMATFDLEGERVRRDALATGKGEYVLDATLTDAAGEVVATTTGTYQVRRLG